jgi:hypothetical protein
MRLPGAKGKHEAAVASLEVSTSPTHPHFSPPPLSNHGLPLGVDPACFAARGDCPCDSASAHGLNDANATLIL